jgi:adenosylcobinamide-GDP ribazoletransferase
MSPVKRLGLAVSYVTCFPLCRIPVDADPQALGGLAKYLSTVGLLVGTVLAGLAWSLNWFQASAIIFGVVLTVAWLAITGAIHFDGLMDTADGVLSHRDRARMLEIMSDSRVGNFGAIVGFAALLLKVAALSTLAYPGMIYVLLVIPAWARWTETYAIGAFNYLRKSGMGKVWHDSMKYPRDLIIGALAPLIVSGVAVHYQGLEPMIACTCTILGGLAAAIWIKQVLGGQTGDTYGAVVEIAETIGLIGTALIVSKTG